jgi:hypothetical protein
MELERKAGLLMEKPNLEGPEIFHPDHQGRAQEGHTKTRTNLTLNFSGTKQTPDNNDSTLMRGGCLFVQSPDLQFIST